jgi:GMP synthase-like glutamine amidotransferase
MRVLAFRHVPFEGAGLLEPVLDQRGIALEYVDLYRQDAVVPDTASAAGLIFLGGPMSVNDGLPYLECEQRLIAEALSRRQPVLGICLGSQLLAKTLGAAVHRNPVKEIGWFDVHTTGDASSDPLLGPLGPVEAVFHWHGETFELPPGATHLAWSERCRNQAFRMPDNVYGLQFHLEVTPEMIADWCLQDENCGDVGELDRPIDAAYRRDHLAALASRVFGAWCDGL